MSWVKLDDRFFDNPKIARMSDEGIIAYLKSLTYCARELTDGELPLRKGKEFARPKAMKELTPGLWEPRDGQLYVHDYLQYNPTRTQVLAERDAAKRRMFALRSGDVRANNGHSSGEVRGTPVDPVSPIPEGDLINPLPIPVIPAPPPEPKAHWPRRELAVGFEQCFGRLLSPMELEQVQALDEEHPMERIEYALREASALNKRSVRYIQRTCERIANDNAAGEPGGNGGGVPLAANDPNGVGHGVSDVERRRAALAERRRVRESEEASVGRV